MFKGLADQRPTYAGRIDSYRRREQMTSWVGAGLGVVVVVAAGDISDVVGGDPVCPQLIAALLTLVIISGASLALARVGFEYQATLLEREVASKNAPATQTITGELCAWPKQAELMWRISLYCLLLAGILFLALVWSSAV